MREIMQCVCVGKRIVKKKDGTILTICYFESDLDKNFGEGVETFQTFDNVDVGDTYHCVRINNGFQLLKMD